MIREEIKMTSRAILSSNSPRVIGQSNLSPRRHCVKKEFPRNGNPMETMRKLQVDGFHMVSNAWKPLSSFHLVSTLSMSIAKGFKLL